VKIIATLKESFKSEISALKLGKGSGYAGKSQTDLRGLKWNIRN
jgi:hypothetical protein